MSRSYDPFDLKGVDTPRVNDGEQASKDVFRVKYLEYLTKHNTKMRKRAPCDRVLPQSVVECTRPSLLEDVCKHLLKEEYRSDNPAEVSTLVIHRWAMKQPVVALGKSESEGIAKIKAIKINLGKNMRAVRNVQRAFINVVEIRKKYHLQTIEREGEGGSAKLSKTKRS